MFLIQIEDEIPSWQIFENKIDNIYEKTGEDKHE